MWHCIIVIFLIIYSCHAVSSCSHYVSVPSVTSYVGYRSTYTICYIVLRCRDGLVWYLIPLWIWFTYIILFNMLLLIIILQNGPEKMATTYYLYSVYSYIKWSAYSKLIHLDYIVYYLVVILLLETSNIYITVKLSGWITNS